MCLCHDMIVVYSTVKFDLKDTTKEEIYARIRAVGSCFGEKNPKEILQDRQLLVLEKKKPQGNTSR